MDSLHAIQKRLRTDSAALRGVHARDITAPIEALMPGSSR
jgi:hypothetical protein